MSVPLCIERNKERETTVSGVRWKTCLSVHLNISVAVYINTCSKWKNISSHFHIPFSSLLGSEMEKGEWRRNNKNNTKPKPDRIHLL